MVQQELILLAVILEQSCSMNLHADAIRMSL